MLSQQQLISAKRNSDPRRSNQEDRAAFTNNLLPTILISTWSSRVGTIPKLRVQTEDLSHEFDERVVYAIVYTCVSKGTGRQGCGAVVVGGRRSFSSETAFVGAFVGTDAAALRCSLLKRPTVR